jgi:hypothetical protein
VGATPPANGWRFDPVAYTRALNALVGRGTEEATSVLLACATDRSCPAGPAELAILARGLFVPHAGDAPLPPPSLGRPDIDLPAADGTWPLLPLVIIDGLSFLCVGGHRVGGAMDFEGWLRRCAALGQVRSEPLSPASTPVDTADTLIQDPLWLGLLSERDQPRVISMVRVQALLATRPDYALADAAANALSSARASDAERLWREYAAGVRALSLKWDPAAGCFRAQT